MVPIGSSSTPPVEGSGARPARRKSSARHDRLQLSAVYSSPVSDDLDRQLRERAKDAVDPQERSLMTELRRRILNGGLELRLFPQAILHLRRVVALPLPDAPRLGPWLELEPSVATGLIDAARNPRYRRFGRVHSVAAAVEVLGPDETRAQVLSILGGAKVLNAASCRGEVEQGYWRLLAMGAAVVSLGGPAPAGEVADAYAAATAAELGRTVVWSAYADLDRGPNATGDVPLHVQDALHAGFGALVAESLKLSPHVVEAIRYHERPAFTPSEAARPLAHVLFLARHAADLAVGRKMDARGAARIAHALGALSLKDDAIETARSAGVARLEYASRVLGRAR